MRCAVASAAFWLTFACLSRCRAEEGGPSTAGSDAPAGAAPKLSFWGVASALTAVTATVKAKTAEVLTAVQETDWRAELEAFQQVGAPAGSPVNSAAARCLGQPAAVARRLATSVGRQLDLISRAGHPSLHLPLHERRMSHLPQGAKEDAAAVGKGADIVVHKAREAAEHLPTQLDQLHLPAALHLPESATALQARAGAASAAAREKAEKGLASLGALGSKLVLGTHDLFEQIRWEGRVQEGVCLLPCMFMNGGQVGWQEGAVCWQPTSAACWPAAHQLRRQLVALQQMHFRPPTFCFPFLVPVQPRSPERDGAH